jgi:hypothetical protein
MPYIITSEDFARGDGGFWIRPDGTLIHVSEKGPSHWDAIERDTGASMEAAYTTGYIRVSFYWSGDETVITFGDGAAVTAWKTLASLLRHSDYKDRPVKVENNGLPYEDPDRTRDFETPAKAASWAMQQAIIRNAAAKVRELQAA